MEKEMLKSALTEIFPAASFEEGAEWVTMSVDPESWKEVALRLRHTAALEFDFLFCLTCVDWKTHLSLVFHFRSIALGHSLVVKLKLIREQPEVETVSDIWRTAEFHEREAYDLFGVRFLNHPDLRRLFMTDDWKGWPLRKDYEDPVNMIRL
jgi:NADH:ubiquinone oxidoreductase subunit C